MCKIGDIILVDSYKSHGKTLNHHSFIVIEDDNGNICGLDYDMIGVVMSSFHDKKHKEMKLKHSGNFLVTFQDENIFNGKNNGKDGFVKTEQFYYFNKDKINFSVIGFMQEDVFEKIIKYIEELKIPIESITENL